MKHQFPTPTRNASGTTILIAALAFSSFLPVSMWAQKVAVTSRSLDASPSADMAGIVSKAASIRMERRGEESLVLEGLDEAALRDPGAVLRQADARGAASFLLAESSEKENRLELRLAWFDGIEGRWIAEISKSCPKDMRLDESIFAAVDELFDRVEAQNPPGLKAPAETGTTQKEPGTSPGQAAEEPAGAEDADSQAVGKSAGPGNTEQAAAPQAPAAASIEGVRKAESGLELGFGLGPFVAAGSLAEFFEAAGCLDARLAWVFAFPRWALHLGLDASGTLIEAKGPLESAQGILAPLALDLRFASVEGSIRPYARAYGGAALLYLKTPIYGDRHVILPFFGAGLGLEWVLRSGITLGPDLSYSVAVDGQDLIMGLTPAIEISIPLGRRP